MSDKKYPHNITREYLANTYGKCESQEHADFICEIAENYGIKLADIKGCSYRHYSSSGFFNFFINDGELVLGFFDSEAASDSGEKLIHLPLPPKENEMESQLPTASSGTEMPEVKLIKPIYTKEMHERGEYPPIGSEVQLRTGVGTIELGVDSVGLFPALINGKYCLVDIGSIKPIPTIEDELVDIFEKAACKTDYSIERGILAIMEKYNITPKGE